MKYIIIVLAVFIIGLKIDRLNDNLITINNCSQCEKSPTLLIK